MRQLPRLLLALLAILALALCAAGAAGADEAPAGSSSATVAEEAPMSLEFTSSRATLVGPRALVPVQCGGLAASSCEGTLVLSGPGGAHKVPYALQLGEHRFLTVPLGDNVDRGCRARVVARTLQLTGGTVRTSSVLRIG
ncbi:MAG: hypothetical protein ACJ76D_05250 [Solirubrobacterales bacterium]